jgi:8-amino-7-oxononanoate synthase
VSPPPSRPPKTAPNAFDQSVSARLFHLIGHGLLRDPAIAETPAGTHISVGGESLLHLCSNNYLGLADDPEIRHALATAASVWGGAGASRLVSGSTRPHRSAEEALASYVQLQDARVFSSGYAANVGAISAFLGPGDVVFSDALNHASLIDGCRLSRDMDALERLLREHRPAGRAALIVSDAVFSMDGDLAPLRKLRHLADAHAAGLLIDEAHALGVIGSAGMGLSAALGIRPDILTGMLGKSFGTSGGFVAGSTDACRLLESTARSYVFSTAMHPALAEIIPYLVHRLRSADGARAQLRRHIRTLAQAIEHDLPEDDDLLSPILPLIIGENAAALSVAQRLKDHGIFIRAIRPPTVPVGTARLRIVPIATHSEEDIAHAARALHTAAVDARTLFRSPNARASRA